MALNKYALTIPVIMRDIFCETLLEVNRVRQTVTWTRDYTESDKDFITIHYKTSKDLFAFAEVWGKNKFITEITKKEGTVIATESIFQFEFVNRLLIKMEISFSIHDNNDNKWFVVEFKNKTQAYSVGVIIGSLIKLKYTSDFESINSLVDSAIEKGTLL